ncbi:MAG: contractile injection system tape measure protein, partial [Bacteroidota bacterium]
MTTNTRYRIQKQILDIRQEQQGDAFARQTELRSRYENEVVPLLEKICDELCPAEQLIRIDTLDIALPPMTEQQYRTSWPTTVEKAFRETLSKAIAKAREPHHQNSTLLSQGEAELQLLTTFLHTGTVPWTYQQGQDRPLETLYKALLKQDPQGVRQMLVKGLRRKSFTERLCYQFPGLFPQLFDLLQPGHTKELSAYYQYLRHYVEHSTYTENNAKAVFLLHYHSLQQLVKQQDQGGKSFAKYTLRRISEAWKTPYNALLSELAKLTTPQRVPQHVQKALQELLLETASGYQETPAEDRFQREVQQLLRKTEQLIRTSETARAVQLETLKARLQQLIRHIETLPPETA